MADVAASVPHASAPFNLTESGPPAGPAPILETVVVSYRCRELLALCLESLRRYPL